MKKLKILLCLFIILSCGSYINAQINKSALEKMKKTLGNTFSLVLKDVKSNNYIISYNADKMMTPASITKLLSTGAVLCKLGGDYRYKTFVYIDGVQNGRKLLGNVIVVGAGDPSLESHYFEEQKGLFMSMIVDGLKSRGIDSIIGNVVVDASRYGKNGVSIYWDDEDYGNYYGAGAYGFNLFDNYFDTYAVVDKNYVHILGTDAYPWIKFINKLKPISRGRNSDNVIGKPMFDTIIHFGNVLVSDTVSLKPAVPNPPRYASIWIKIQLQDSGIFIIGDAVHSFTPIEKKNPTLLTEYQSLPLRDIVYITNHVSHNMFAESITRELEYRASKKTIINYNSPKALTQFWVSTLQNKYGKPILYDGSGLSRSDKMSVKFISAVINYMIKTPNVSKDFINSLPIAGEFYNKKNSVRKLKVSDKYIARIKSGSMKGVKSYAGIVEYKGQTYVIGFICNGNKSGIATDSFTTFLNETFR